MDKPTSGSNHFCRSHLKLAPLHSWICLCFNIQLLLLLSFLDLRFLPWRTIWSFCCFYWTKVKFLGPYVLSLIDRPLLCILFQLPSRAAFVSHSSVHLSAEMKILCQLFYFAKCTEKWRVFYKFFRYSSCIFIGRQNLFSPISNCVLCLPFLIFFWNLQFTRKAKGTSQWRHWFSLEGLEHGWGHWHSVCPSLLLILLISPWFCIR